MYPPLYDKMKKLLSVDWKYSRMTPKRRKYMMQVKGKLRDIDACVRDYGLGNVLLTPSQKTLIEETYKEVMRGKGK